MCNLFYEMEEACLYVVYIVHIGIFIVVAD